MVSCQKMKWVSMKRREGSAVIRLYEQVFGSPSKISLGLRGPASNTRQTDPSIGKEALKYHSEAILTGRSEEDHPSSSNPQGKKTALLLHS